jgi:DNA mismatch endonuclease (patch repair protein)
MARIRSKDTKPELLLRRALWASGVRGWRCDWKAPGGRIDIAFTRWRVAVFVDGSFWHGHPSKWQPGRWEGYWDEKIKRNMARDRRQDDALRAAGWRAVRLWDFEVEQDPAAAAGRVEEALEAARHPSQSIVETGQDIVLPSADGRV